MKLINGVSRIFRYYLIRLKRLSGNPKALAGGIAIGVFVGLSPTIPLHTALIVALALATRTSVIAGILVSWIVCNPVTFFPIYYIAVHLGNHLTPYEINFDRVQLLLAQLTQGGSFHASVNVILGLGVEAIVVLLVGGFVFALPFAFVSYYLAVPFFKRRQLAKERKARLKNSLAVPR